MNRFPFLAVLWAVCAHVSAQTAQTAPAAPSSTGSLLQVLLGLVAVLALMAGAAWLLKRMGVSGGVAGSVAKVVGGVSVGHRERVVVVEVADQWIVVGVAPGRVNALATLPRQELPAGATEPANAKTFSAWLQQTIDKRNGKQ